MSCTWPVGSIQLLVIVVLGLSIATFYRLGGIVLGGVLIKVRLLMMLPLLTTVQEMCVLPPMIVLGTRTEHRMSVFLLIA